MAHKYRLFSHAQRIQDLDRILGEALDRLRLGRQVGESARDGVVGYAAEVVRWRCQRGGDGSVEGVGGAEAVVEDERGAGGGVFGWEVGVEDAAAGDGEVGHGQLRNECGSDGSQFIRLRGFGWTRAPQTDLEGSWDDVGFIL